MRDSEAGGRPRRSPLPSVLAAFGLLMGQNWYVIRAAFVKQHSWNITHFRPSATGGPSRDAIVGGESRSATVFTPHRGFGPGAWVGERGLVAPPMAPDRGQFGSGGIGDSAVDPNSGTCPHSGDRWQDPHTGCLSGLCVAGLSVALCDS